MARTKRCVRKSMSGIKAPQKQLARVAATQSSPSGFELAGSKRYRRMNHNHDKTGLT